MSDSDDETDDNDVVDDDAAAAAAADDDDDDDARREAVQVRGDFADLQSSQLGDGRRHVRRLHGGVQDVRPRGTRLHRRRRAPTCTHIPR